MGGTSCDVCVVEDGARARDAPGARSAGARWRCRWSTSTPSAPAAARSPGATRAARCASGRARRAPTRARRATGAAGPSRRSPTPTSCSGTSTRTRRWPAACALDAGAARARGRRGWRGELGLSDARACARGHRARRQRRDGPRAARHDRRARDRPARASRCWPSAAPGRCTRRRSPTSSGSRAILVPRAARRAERARARGGRAPRATRAQRCCCAATALTDDGAAPALARRRRRGRAGTLRYAGQSHELALRDVAPRRRARCARRSPPRTRSATATATTTPRSSSSRSGPRAPSSPGPTVALGGRRRRRGDAAIARPGGRARCPRPTLVVPDGLARRDRRDRRR